MKVIGACSTISLWYRLALTLIQNKLMDTIPSEQRFDSLSPEVFDKVEELSENGVEDDMHTLVVLDDVSSELRKKKWKMSSTS